MTLTSWRYRGGVAARALAAIGGGYLIASSAGALLALALPMARADAVTIATMLSIVVYAGVILWVFATRSALRACAGVLTASALLGEILWWVGGTA